jgi:hypothetical protein
MAGLISVAGYPTGINTRAGASVGEVLYPRAGAGFVVGKILSGRCGCGRVILGGCVPVAISIQPSPNGLRRRSCR